MKLCKILFFIFFETLQHAHTHLSYKSTIANFFAILTATATGLRHYIRFIRRTCSKFCQRTSSSNGNLGERNTSLSPSPYFQRHDFVPFSNDDFTVHFMTVDRGSREGRRSLGRPRRRWVDSIRMDLQEVGCGYMDWIGLAQDRDRWRTLVSAVMNLRVP